MVAVASSRTESCERHILCICGSHHAADILNTVLFSINQTGTAGEQPLPALHPIPKKKKNIHFFSLLLYDPLRRTGPTTQKKKDFFFFSKPVNFISSYRRACWAKALGEYNVHVCKKMSLGRAASCKTADKSSLLMINGPVLFSIFKCCAILKKLTVWLVTITHTHTCCINTGVSVEMRVATLKSQMILCHLCS